LILPTQTPGAASSSRLIKEATTLGCLPLLSRLEAGYHEKREFCYGDHFLPLQMAESLPREEQLRLIQELAQHAEDSAEGKTSVLELCGLGQEIWQQLDAQQYVRAAWNG
jgi:hypothetical protein